MEDNTTEMNNTAESAQNDSGEPNLITHNAVSNPEGIGTISNNYDIDGTSVIAHNIDHIAIGSSNKIDIDKYLKDYKPATIGNIYWTKLKDQWDEENYKENLANLLNDKIIFIEAIDSTYCLALVKHLLLNEDEFKNKKHKQISFVGYDEVNSYSFYDWAETLKRKKIKDAVIVVDLSTLDQPAENQRRYYSTLLNIRHEETIQCAQDNNFYIINLISAQDTHLIKGRENGSDLYYTWTIKGQQQQKKINIEKAFSLGPIHQVVIYTAAFFDRIPARTFSFLVELFLSHSQFTEPIIIEEYTNVDHESAKKITRISEDNPLAVWKIYQDKIFADCGIDLKDGEKGKIIVDIPNIQSIRAYIKYKHHFFCQKQFDIVEHLHLHFSTDNAIASRAIDLFIDAIISDPDFYDSDWFIQSIYDIDNFEKKDYIVEGDTPEQLEQNFIIDYIKRNNYTEHFYRKTGELLEKLILTDQDSPTIKGFLNNLLQHSNFDILLRLIKKLLKIDAFDAIYWLKQLIERGANEIKNEAYYLLIRLYAARRQKVWNSVIEWLPNNKPAKNYSPSNRYSSIFLIHIQVLEITGFPIANYGINCFNHSVFQISNNNEDIRGKVKFILDKSLSDETENQFTQLDIYGMSVQLFAGNWLGDKTISRILDIPPDNLEALSLQYEESYLTLVAEIIESVFHIIKGFDSGYTEQQQLLNRYIIQCLLSEEDNKRPKIQSILRHWDRKPGIYLRQTDWLRQYIKNNKERLSAEEIQTIEAFISNLLQRKINMQYLFEELTIKNQTL